MKGNGRFTQLIKQSRQVRLFICILLPVKHIVQYNLFHVWRYLIVKVVQKMNHIRWSSTFYNVCDSGYYVVDTTSGEVEDMLDETPDDEELTREIREKLQDFHNGWESYIRLSM